VPPAMLGPGAAHCAVERKVQLMGESGR
jgi:hypothetical protein